MLAWAPGTGAVGHSDTYPTHVSNLGPVAYWRLGEPSGTVAADEMGAFDGTYVNTPTLGVPGLLTGDTDTAVTFTAASSELVFTTVATTVVDNWTMVAWVKPTAASGTPRTIVENGSGTGYSLLLDGANKLWGLRDGAGAVLVDNTGPALSTTEPSMAVLLRRAGTSYLYLNGALSVTGNTSTPTTPATLTTIGATAAPTFFMDGIVDEVAIFDRALTATEIADLYALGTDGPTASPLFGLYVGGLDTINNASIQTPVGSIRIVENGPGGVSTMDFDIWDRGAAFTIGEDTPVSFWDLTNNVCLFRGTIDGWSSKPAFATGRICSVGCVGVEKILDDIYVPPGLVSYAYSQSLPTGIGKIAQAVAPMLRAPNDPSMFSFFGPVVGYSRDGSADFPIGSMERPTEPALPVFAASLATWINPGGSLRETFSQMLGQVVWYDITVGGAPGGEGVKGLLTVDFYLGLRLWEDRGESHGVTFPRQPDDYTTLTVTDTVAGTTAATRVTYNVEPGDVEHEVYIVGGNAAGSGLFGDGTGIRGKQGSITDSTIMTAAAASTRAAAYLAGQSQSVRGTVSLENIVAPTTVHAGSILNLTDAPSGATGTWRIYSITKTFHGTGRQDWEVAFGGLKPSAARLVRRIIAARG